MDSQDHDDYYGPGDSLFGIFVAVVVILLLAAVFFMPEDGPGNSTATSVSDKTTEMRFINPQYDAFSGQSSRWCVVGNDVQLRANKGAVVGPLHVRRDKVQDYIGKPIPDHQPYRCFEYIPPDVRDPTAVYLTAADSADWELVAPIMIFPRESSSQHLECD